MSVIFHRASSGRFLGCRVKRRNITQRGDEAKPPSLHHPGDFNHRAQPLSHLRCLSRALPEPVRTPRDGSATARDPFARAPPPRSGSEQRALAEWAWLGARSAGTVGACSLWPRPLPAPAATPPVGTGAAGARRDGASAAARVALIPAGRRRGGGGGTRRRGRRKRGSSR